jgi:hypothetical protein
MDDKFKPMERLPKTLDGHVKRGGNFKTHRDREALYDKPRAGHKAA